MKATLPLLLLALAFGALLPGLADSAALALGGSSNQTFLAWAFLLCAVGYGAAGWGPPRWRRSLSPARAWPLAVLWLAAAGPLLPKLAPTLGSLAAGPPLSLATLWAWLLLVLLLGWPVCALGARLGLALQQSGARGWNGLLLLGGAGFCAATALGLGPLGWLAAVALAGAAGALLPPQPDAPREDAGFAALRGLAPMALLGVSLALGFSFLLPYLELYDGSAAIEDAVRMTTLLAVALLGAATFGAAISEARGARLAAAFLCGGLAAGWAASVAVLAAWENPRIFNGFVGADWLVRFNADDRLMEGDPLYVPVLAIRVGVLALLFGGSAWRLLARAASGDGTPPAPAALGVFLFSAGAGTLFLGYLAHPTLTQWRAAVAMGFALAAAAAAAWTTPYPRPALLRAGAALGIVAAGAFLLPWRPAPPTSVPFFDNFEWEVVAEEPAVGSLARVAKRRAATRLGDQYLTDGRNLIGASEEERAARAMEEAFAAALVAQPRRALLVGAPLADFGGLRGLGAEEVHVACDPPELVDLARTATDEGLRIPREWEGVMLDGVTATVAEAGGRFDWVLVRDEAIWDRRRNPLRPATIATCARKLTDDGVLAVALDPERCIPGLVGAVARAVADALPVTEIWLLPRGWHSPRLLVTGRQQDTSPRDGARLAEVLASYGLSVGPGDAELLRIAGPDAVVELAALSLAPPLPHSLAGLGEVEYRREDEIRPELRAGATLAALEAALGDRARDSLLAFYARHLQGQLYSTADTLIVHDYESIDVDRSSLDALMELTRRHPGSRLLRQSWAGLAYLIVNKRELGLIEDYYAPLADELNWDVPEIHTALGHASLELLQAEDALRRAQQALALAPTDRNALLLKAEALAQLERPGEAAETYLEIMQRTPEPGSDLLNARGEALLDAGDEDGARKIARVILQRFGQESLQARLGALLGLEPSDVTHGLLQDD